MSRHDGKRWITNVKRLINRGFKEYSKKVEQALPFCVPGKHIYCHNKNLSVEILLPHILNPGNSLTQIFYPFIWLFRYSVGLFPIHFLKLSE